MSAAIPDSPRLIGRYLMAGPIAVGGMASVHFGKVRGDAGFSKAVAIKRMLAPSTDLEARAMLLDEARLASRVRHANVVQTLDVVEEGSELFIVLEYVHGETFDQLLQRAMAAGHPCPPAIVAAVVAGALRGLHAAHEAKGDDGQPLDLVHRDVSPQNLLIGIDGQPRVLDFGVARGRGRLQGTRAGQLKGKLAYLSPEQVHGEASRRSDIFSAGIVLWEALAGERLFDAPSEAEVLSKVLLCRVPALEGPAERFQAVVDRALEREPEARFGTALEMAEAIEALGAASTAELSAWVKELASDVISLRERALDQLRPASAPSTVVDAPTRSRKVVPLVVAGALLVLGGLGARLAWRGDSAETIAEPGPAPKASIGPVVTPPIDVPSTKPPEKPVERPRPVIARPAAKPSPEPPSRGHDRCDPPFTIDSSGVKTFKPECFK